MSLGHQPCAAARMRATVRSCIPNIERCRAALLCPHTRCMSSSGCLPVYIPGSTSEASALALRVAGKAYCNGRSPMSRYAGVRCAPSGTADTLLAPQGVTMCPSTLGLHIASRVGPCCATSVTPNECRRASQHWGCEALLPLGISRGCLCGQRSPGWAGFGSVNRDRLAALARRDSPAVLAL